MTVWAFACKVESSNNRWFDGSDQNVDLADNGIVAKFDKGVGDSVYTTDRRWSFLQKSVSPVHRAIGSYLFNLNTFNGQASTNGDAANTVYMEDEFSAELQREVLHINNSVVMLDNIAERSFESSVFDNATINDSIITNANDDLFGIENISFIEVPSVSFTKEINNSAEDSFSFTEGFDVSVGGKRFRDSVFVEDSGIEKDIQNVVGTEVFSGPLNSIMFNEIAIGDIGNEPSIVTNISIVEEVEIYIT